MSITSYSDEYIVKIFEQHHNNLCGVSSFSHANVVMMSKHHWECIEDHIQKLQEKLTQAGLAVDDDANGFYLLDKGA